jgi:deoxyribonuclease V
VPAAHAPALHRVLLTMRGSDSDCGKRRTLSGMATWPATADELTQLQHALGELTPEPWQPPANVLRIGACFVCFERVHGAGVAGDRGFAGAAVTHRCQLLAGVSVSGPAGGPYRPALLALREGPLLEQAVRALPITPEVLVVNATGRDHPRRAGRALHLRRAWAAHGRSNHPTAARRRNWPVDQRAATAPLRLGGEVVGCWVRTRSGARPVAVHAAWQTDAQAAVQVVLAATRRARTPEPPAPRPHPGSNPAGTHALNAATRAPACCSRPDYGWCFLVGGRLCVGLAGYRASRQQRHGQWLVTVVAGNGPFPADSRRVNRPGIPGGSDS